MYRRINKRTVQNNVLLWKIQCDITVVQMSSQCAFLIFRQYLNGFVKHFFVHFYKTMRSQNTVNLSSCQGFEKTPTVVSSCANNRHSFPVKFAHVINPTNLITIGQGHWGTWSFSQAAKGTRFRYTLDTQALIYTLTPDGQFRNTN